MVWKINIGKAEQELRKLIDHARKSMTEQKKCDGAKQICYYNYFCSPTVQQGRGGGGGGESRLYLKVIFWTNFCAEFKSGEYQVF